jgi:hypothetical protein
MMVAILREVEKVLYALTPNTVELIPALRALSPRGGPVQDPRTLRNPKLIRNHIDSSRAIVILPIQLLRME